MKKSSEIYLFEEMPIPQAVARMCIPTVLSSLVMILYNLADTYFVGMLNDPVQNAAVTLAFPVLLAFNAVTNLFGVGTSSVMSRSLGTMRMCVPVLPSVFTVRCLLVFCFRWGACYVTIRCCGFWE